MKSPICESKNTEMCLMFVSKYITEIEAEEKMLQQQLYFSAKSVFIQDWLEDKSRSKLSFDMSIFLWKIFWNWLGQLCTFFLTCNSLWKFCWKIEKWKWYLIKEEAMLLIVNMIYNVKIFLNSWEHSKA